MTPVAELDAATLGDERGLGEAQRHFRRDGVVVVRGLVPVATITRFRAHFSEAMRSLLAHRSASIGRDADLDALYRASLAADPEGSATLLTLGRDLPPFFELVDRFARAPLVKALVGASTLQINYDVDIFRVDPPDRDETGFAWHQDYPYNMLSMSAVTVWAPITRVDAAMGPMRCVPGSHSEFLDIEIDERPASKYTQQRQLRIHPRALARGRFEDVAVDLPPIDAGDVVLFHCLLVHRSGANRSDRCRWVFNARYGDLCDPAVVDRAWWVHAREVSAPRKVDPPG